MFRRGKISILVTKVVMRAHERLRFSIAPIETLAGVRGDGGEMDQGENRNAELLKTCSFPTTHTAYTQHFMNEAT